MELRVLKYFLMTAREENITKAANLLHITQPTLSRQLMKLEEDLGVKLFRRSNHSIVLTEDGMLLKRRAQEIVTLAEKTEQELSRREEELTGSVSIGCGETRNMSVLSEHMAAFREKHPLVRFNIYSATADEIKERIEKGILDFGLLLEPVDISRYDFVRMPHKEQWGALVREDSPLADKEFVTPEDFRGAPVIMARRESVKNELAGWFGEVYEELEIAATYNLLLNAVNMVKNHVGAALGFNLDSGYAGLKFIPFLPKLESGAVLVWKKDQVVSEVTKCFRESVKKDILEISLSPICVAEG